MDPALERRSAAMAEGADQRPPEELRKAAFEAVNVAFGSVGRVCMALDSSFCVRHVSKRLDAILGPGAAKAWLGAPIENLLGPELFGPGGPLRLALLAGEMREGWRASLRVEPVGSRLLSVTAAPILHDDTGVCDPDAAYIIVMRPADETDGTAAQATTGFAGLIARSPSMTRIFRLVENLQASEATTLLTGESGTGKEVLARAIHAHSPRRDGPFVAVSCAALPGELLESELFGHVRGAFTGAVRDRAGRFELAARGTLFLDEVGDVPLHLQVKLLRVLQERTYERVGENRTRETDARIIAATNRDLRRAVEEGAFRQDLYYRLRVFPIELPPLRERREDIEPLAGYLLGRVGARHGRALRFSPDALRAILAYRWPGNVREMENALEYAVTVAKGQTLQPEDLPPEVLGSGPREAEALPPREDPDGRWGRAATSGAGDPARREGEVEERLRIQSALDASRWNRASAAHSLGMSRTTLWRKMRELGFR
jgi:transcriptional regulator with GAF, ATPase, and Fis domain